MSHITSSELTEKTIASLPFPPAGEQQEVIEDLSVYICEAPDNGVFLLNGYAGTGKTTVIAALVKALHSFKIKTVLLAPTGRAAKIAGNKAHDSSSTIHRRLYHPDPTRPDGAYTLSPNRDSNTVFIVDEASMIAGRGSNSLLAHLVRHIYSGHNCRMILVGDDAQLPPVGEQSAPAMNLDVLKRLGLEPFTNSLDTILRQEIGSGITHNATMVRTLMKQHYNGPFPDLRTSIFNDIHLISSADLEDCLSTSWATKGVEETVVITRSNSRANRYNQTIRQLIMYAEEPLQCGDRLVIARNDYYWSKINKLKTFVANGDIAVINHVGRTEKAYGRYFTDVELTFPADGSVMSVKLMLRSLAAEGPTIPAEEMKRFEGIVMNHYPGAFSEKVMQARKDPYYNALHAKYAYCVTCHKAQGGEWKDVYIDMSGLDIENLTEDFYRWFYTALTRASERVYLINCPFPEI